MFLFSVILWLYKILLKKPCVLLFPKFWGLEWFIGGCSDPVDEVVDISVKVSSF
ncbi:Uncharacterised protein [Sphingobacterium daejeonense]|nr:Uncharacterised protein [Sphingobacterium daejeonense]